MRPGNSENDDLAQSEPIGSESRRQEEGEGGGGEVIYNLAELLARDNADG